MSIFPTRILVATDGSREAQLALTTAADLAKSTDSELHVLHVGEVPLVYHPERHAYQAEYEEHEKEAQQLLEAQGDRIEGVRGSARSLPSYHCPGVEAPGNFRELRTGELRRIYLLHTGVKIALAAAPFSWFRGGPARAMGHFGEKGVACPSARPYARGATNVVVVNG